MIQNIFFFEYRADFYIMWKKRGKARQATNDNIIERIRFACCITKPTKAHPEYVIIFALLRQQ